MKTRTILLLIAFLGLVLMLLIAGGNFLLNQLGRPAVETTPLPEEPSGTNPEIEASLPVLGTAATPPLAAFPPAVWGRLPECANHPVGVEEWNKRAGDDPAARQAALVAPGLAAPGLMAAADGSPEATALAMNVATGKLNRLTEIQTAAVPDVNTVGELLDRIAAAQGQPELAAPLAEAARQVESGQGITRPICARMVVTNAQNQPEQVLWGEGGVATSAMRTQAAVTEQGPETAQPPLVMDTGVASPNGKWAAYTSLGMDAGGPVFLQNLETGEWTNLIQLMNRTITDGALPDDAFWDIIGWFPDSRRIMIGPADAGSIYIVPVSGEPFQAIGLSSGGEGGGRVVGLAPDGSRFVYLALGPGDVQSLTLVDLSTNESRTLMNVPMNEGILHYPRFSPDGNSISFIQQKGHPLTGVTEAIWLVYVDTGTAARLVEGGLGLSVPTWSPDGSFLAFTRKDTNQPELTTQGEISQPQRSNIWVASIPDGKVWQVTQVDGQARNPAWTADSATLGFVTHDGQVGMVNIHHPGQAWKAAETSTELPLFTSVFFVP